MPPWNEFIDAMVADDRDHPAVPWFWRRQDLVEIVRTWSKTARPASITGTAFPI